MSRPDNAGDHDVPLVDKGEYQKSTGSEASASDLGRVCLRANI